MVKLVAPATTSKKQRKFRMKSLVSEGMTTTDNEGFIRAAKDITAGCVGGIAQVLTGQPFDLVKVFQI